jgi:hypothetical protein
MKSYKKTAIAVLGMSAVLLAGNALAVGVTLEGTNVTYSFDDADLGLFGTASVSGDSLEFSPVNFSATSNGTLPAFTYQTLNVTVSINDPIHNQLSAFSLAESGSYTMGSNASVGVTGKLTALDIEGTTNNKMDSTIVATSPFNAANGNWNAAAGVALPATGWGGADGLVHSVSLTISNQLYVTGGIGDIMKNAVMVNASVSPVPEAETYAMMLAGLGLIGFMVGRRNRV